MRRFAAGAGHAVAPGLLIDLPPREAHHLRDVLRAHAGREIELIGGGSLYRATVESVGPGGVQVRVGDPLPDRSLAPVEVVCAIPWLKAGHTETLVQKLTELGAAQVILWRAERCVARGDTEKLPRLERVALDACKQCGRAAPPVVTVGGNLTETISATSLPPDRVLLLAEPAADGTARRFSEAAASALSGSEGTPRIALVSGPEGGFDALEMKRAGGLYTATSLGPRILRAETAPLAAMAVLLAAAGEF